MGRAHKFLRRREFLTNSGWLSAPAAFLDKSSNRRFNSFLSNHQKNIYAQLGVTTVINAFGTVTRLGGSIMPPDIVAAMEEAGQYFVSLSELHQKIGERLAQLIGVEAATITSGAAGAITLGTAACVTGGDPKKIQQLPDTTGMKNQVIIQKAHRYSYEAQIRLVGTTIVGVETKEELEAAINEKTAMLFFINTLNSKGQIDRSNWVKMGKKYGIPTFNDAAADIPPPNRLSKYINLGFDLVTFSGGKGLLGPQCSGLLVGRKDLVLAARHNGSPWSGIGRGMKVGKEEMVGLLVAVERYLGSDYEANKRFLKSRLDKIISILSPIEGLTMQVFVPEIANHVPHLSIEWTLRKIRLTSNDARRQLQEGNPAVAVGPHLWGQPKVIHHENQQGLTVSVWMLQPGEAQIVAHRIKDILIGSSLNSGEKLT